jgi:hypothetical protein
MRHIPNSSQKHVPVVHIRHNEHAATADDCVACHIRTALARSGEILWALALSKRHKCHAAGECSDTGLPIADNEPPPLETCECFLTRKIVHEVFDIQGNLEVMVDEADRLARMVDRYAGHPGEIGVDVARHVWQLVKIDYCGGGSGAAIVVGSGRRDSNPAIAMLH